MTVPDTEEILWEEICCPLCSNGDEDLLLAVPAEPAETLYRLVRCRHCGMVYVNPRPVQPLAGSRATVDQEEPSAVSALVADNAQPATAWEQLRLWLERLILSCYHGYPPARTSWWERLLAALARPLVGARPESLMPPPYVGEGRLLDYRCGLGPPVLGYTERLGRRLQQRGWKVLELSGFPERETVRQEVEDRTRFLTVSLPGIPPGSLDAIVMERVLGRAPWPHPVIEQAARALRPGGLLAVCVPNLDSWGFRTFGMKWSSLDVPRRLLYFTPATLKHLISRHGLEIMEVRFVGRTSWMRRSLQNQSYPALLAGLLARWTVWSKQADSILMLARRQETAAATVRLAA